MTPGCARRRLSSIEEGPVTENKMTAAVKSAAATREYYFEEGCYITELSNSADDVVVSIARARLAPGDTTRWHKLRDTGERYVLLEGYGRVEIGECPPQDVGPGDVVLIPPCTRQRITSVGERDLIFLAICSPPFTPDVYIDSEDEQASG